MLSCRNPQYAPRDDPQDPVQAGCTTIVGWVRMCVVATFCVGDAHTQRNVTCMHNASPPRRATAVAATECARIGAAWVE